MTTATLTPITPAGAAQVASVNAYDLSRALANALLAAGQDDTLPIIRGVHLRFADGALRLSATDRYRLLVETVDAECGTSWAAILDREDVATIRTLVALTHKRLPKNARQPLTVQLERDGSHVEVKVGEFSARLDVVVGEFPKVEKLIADNPPEPVASLPLNRQYVADIGRITPKHPTEPVVLSFGRPINNTEGTPNTKQPVDFRPMRADFGDRLTYLLMPIRTSSGAR